MNLKRNRKGFTLIELIIIIIILGILAAVAIPKYMDMRQDAVNSTVKAMLGGMRGANTVLWGNRIISNNTNTYSFPEIIASMDLKGGMITTISNLTMTVALGASTYQFTLAYLPTVSGATAVIPPSQFAQIYLDQANGAAVASPSIYTLW
ncbi:MAG: prepilin-type N-terminal cleavage/methylation domain-containing protein [Syntrophorhabdales bacterium]|jgi:prepilin-type N-terminal cleavage/methylation domain-containing protein